VYSKKILLFNCRIIVDNHKKIVNNLLTRITIKIIFYIYYQIILKNRIYISDSIPVFYYRLFYGIFNNLLIRIIAILLRFLLPIKSFRVMLLFFSIIQNIPYGYISSLFNDESA